MAITSFKVIDLVPIGKPICDFLLVINSNLTDILHRFQIIADYMSNFRYSDSGSLHFNALVGGWFPVNIAINDIPLKTRFFGLHFTRRMYRCIFNHFYVIGPKSYRVRRNNANYAHYAVAVQRHSRSPTGTGTNRGPICDFLLVQCENCKKITGGGGWQIWG